MKYYLSVDRGDYYKPSEKYHILDIKKINPEFGYNNNLQILCQFTMLFSDIYSLKNYLIKENILASNLRYFDLKLIYKYKENIFCLLIPFRSDEKYFHISYLTSILLDKKSDLKFLKIFLNQFKFHAGLPDDIYTLKRYANEGYSKDPVDAIIRNFIHSICYPNRQLNFRRLYDLVMILKAMTKEDLKREDPDLITSLPAKEELITQAEEQGTQLIRKKNGYEQYTLF